MATCDACGNDYDRAFTVTTSGGEKYTFDSLECAISRIAPVCERCSVRIIGHGLQRGGRIFCCDHCAEMSGVKELRDRS
jgi:hypothetical protein